MRVKLSDHFTYKKILSATISPILMMVFISIYSIVDGLFISNFASLSAFAGVNLIFPLIMIVGGLGFMLGTGGSALVSKLLGEKKNEDANKVFTMLVLFSVALGIFASTLGVIFIKPIAEWMGSFSTSTTDEMIDHAIKYGRILVAGQTLFILQNVFQSFFVVNERPGLSFIFTLASGVTNMILDLLFVGIFKMGVVGAAIATLVGYTIGSIGPIIYFFKTKNGLIKFQKTRMHFKPILQSCFNGSSEFVNNISTSVVAVVFNILLLKYFGAVGVNAYGIIMYLSFIFTSIFIGYSIGISPMISYNYGAKNHAELKNLLRKSSVIVAIFSFGMFLISFFGAGLFSSLFTNGDAELLNLSKKGMQIYSIAFLMIGFSIYISSFFTALNNGLISAIISFFRTIVSQISLAIILPLILGGYGIFWAILVSEVISIVMALFFLFNYKKKYNY